MGRAVPGGTEDGREGGGARESLGVTARERSVMVGYATTRLACGAGFDSW